MKEKAKAEEGAEAEWATHTRGNICEDEDQHQNAPASFGADRNRPTHAVTTSTEMSSMDGVLRFTLAVFITGLSFSFKPEMS